MEKVLINGEWRYAVKVGETKFNEFAGMGDGVLTEYNEDGLKLYFILNRPTSEEKESVSSSGSFEISFSYVEGCGVLQYKFGSLPWSDCIFEPRLYGKNVDYPDLEKEEGKGLGLYIFLIDPSKGGLVEGLRVIGLGRDFSLKFIEWCNKVKGMPFNIEKHNKSAEMIMKEYDGQDLLRRSLFRWKSGSAGDGKERSPMDRDTR